MPIQYRSCLMQHLDNKEQQVNIVLTRSLSVEVSQLSCYQHPLLATGQVTPTSFMLSIHEEPQIPKLGLVRAWKCDHQFLIVLKAHSGFGEEDLNDANEGEFVTFSNNKESRQTPHVDLRKEDCLHQPDSGYRSNKEIIALCANTSLLN